MSESPPFPSPCCPICGSSLPATAQGRLCPRCLMAEVMAPTEGGAGTVATPPRLVPPEDLAPHFPQLEVQECIGRGGMGVVYKARQKTLNRTVALKLLAPEQDKDSTFAGRFAREARALAALSHPSIVTIYDFGEAGGFYYLLMEFIDGVNLRQAMRAGRFTPEQALAIVPPVCEALQYAHEHGVVHRDIKPENLLLDKEGRIKIADFGIAKMLDAPSAPPPESATDDIPANQPGDSLPAGTPQYMAPEQKEQRRTDHRADIYSLGVVLYEMLTGELPSGQIQPPSRKVAIDVRLDEIVLRALEQTPELRYQTAVEFRTRVESFARPPALGAEAPSLTASALGGGRFRWAGSASLACAVAAVLLFLSRVFVIRTATSPRLVDGTVMINQPAAAMGILLAVLFVLLLPASFVLGGLWLFQKLGFPAHRQKEPSVSQWPALGIAGVLFASLSGELGWQAAITAQPSDVLVWSILLAAVAGLLLSLSARRSIIGKVGIVIALCNIAIWIAFAVLFAARHESVAVAQPAAYIFGPERMCFLPDPQPGTACLLDFESGAFATPPDDLAGKLERGDAELGENWVQWLRKSGVDAVVQLPGNHSVRLFEGAVLSVAHNAQPPMTFDRFAADAVVTALNGARWEREQRFIKSDRTFYATPATATAQGPRPGLVFITREGSMGVMELQGRDPAHPGVKLRYKLVAPVSTNAPPPGASALRSVSPKTAHISRNKHSVMVVHDDVEAHYVFFYDGLFSTSSGGSFNTRTLLWHDDGAIILGNEFSFGFARDSVTPEFVRINGKEHDLRKGRVFVLQDNGTVFQQDFPLTLASAMDPDLMARETKARPPFRSVFGPQVERVLPSGVPCRQQYFQFQNGLTFVVGRGPDTTEEQYAQDWRKVEEASGFDFNASCSEEGLQLVGEGCVFTRDAGGVDLNVITADGALNLLKHASFTYGVLELKTKELPATYLFKTARGEAGVLQILAVVEDERGYSGTSAKGRGLKFRYKLVQGSDISRS